MKNKRAKAKASGLVLCFLLCMQGLFAATLGDVNNSGSVDIIDAMQTAQYAAGLVPSGFNASMADVDCLNGININDALNIARYSAGIIKNFPCAATPTPTVTVTPTRTPTATPTLVSGDITLSPGTAANLASAITSIKPGNTITLQAGTYNYSSTITIAEGNNGTSGALKSIVASGTVILDFSVMTEDASNRGIVLAGSYWRLKGITIRRAGDNGLLIAGHYNSIEGCTFLANRDSGCQLSRLNSSYTSISQWPSNNLIVDCISRENKDSDEGDADGFAPKLTCGSGNIFRNCKALYNSDDGWDLYTKSDTGAIGVVTIEGCEASYNGKNADGSETSGNGNGFKLGDDTAPVPHVLRNCVANYNKAYGFEGNGNPAHFTIENCTGTGNGKTLFNRIQ